jgi:hypothetical protein
MESSWEVKLHPDFLPSCDAYEAEFLPQNRERILLGSGVDQKGARTLVEIVDTVARYKQTNAGKTTSGNEIGQLPISEISNQIRELKNGPWRVLISTDESSTPKKALIYRIFHKRDYRKAPFTAQLLKLVRARANQ